MLVSWASGRGWKRILSEAEWVSLASSVDSEPNYRMSSPLLLEPNFHGKLKQECFLWVLNFIFAFYQLPFSASYFFQEKLYFIEKCSLKSKMESRQEFCHWCEWQVLCTYDPSDDIPLNVLTALQEAHPAGSLWASSLPKNNSGQLPHECDLIQTLLLITMQAASRCLYFGIWHNLPAEMCL